MLGINSYRLPQDTGRLMRAKGVQRATFGRVCLGTNTYGQGTQFASRLIARGREMQAFGMGRMGATEGTKPWWESLFSHIETMSITMAPFVMQILDMSFEQQRAGWARTDAREREQAYQTMIMSLVGQKTGSGKYQFSDARSQQFLLQQFRNAPAGTQNQVINDMAGGDAEVASALKSLVSPWYMKLEVTLPLGIAAVAGIVGIVWYTSK